MPIIMSLLSRAQVPFYGAQHTLQKAGYVPVSLCLIATAVFLFQSSSGYFLDIERKTFLQLRAGIFFKDECFGTA